MAEGAALYMPARGINPCYRPHVAAQQRTQLFYGGAGSGKSVFLATRAVLDALCGRNTLVVRQVARTLRESCFNEITKAIARLQVGQYFDIRRGDLAITCLLSGAQILFHGLDDAEKVKSITPASGALTDIWVEEATECRWEDVKQLEKRLRGRSRHKKRLTLSFNPVSTGHWLYREYFGDWQEGQREHLAPDLLILQTTYRDNAFLTEDDRAAYEGERNAYFRQVYTLGEWGVQAGAVYTSWRQEDLRQLLAPPGCVRLGLDFGFAHDPAAFVQAVWDREHRRVYVQQAAYWHGLSNEGLAQRLKPLAGRLPVTCDSAEPKAVAALRQHGIAARPARKGPDSLRHGIRFLQGAELVVDPGCRELIEELHNYRWRKDARGDPQPIPQGEDHLLDALRYALEADSLAATADTG